MTVTPDCECYRRVNPNDATDPGRNFELCTGQFNHGRKPPTLANWNAWRAERNLPPIADNVPASKTDHKNRGGSVKTSGNGGKFAEKPWDVSQPSRGLGDTFEKITHWTGAKQLYEAGRRALGIKKPCGCKGRANKLNQIFPYSGG